MPPKIVEIVTFASFYVVVNVFHRDVKLDLAIRNFSTINRSMNFRKIYLKTRHLDIQALDDL